MEQFLHLPGIWYAAFFVSLIGLLLLCYWAIRLKYIDYILHDYEWIIREKADIITGFTALVFLLGCLVIIALSLDKMKEIVETSQNIAILLVSLGLLVLGSIFGLIFYTLPEIITKKMKISSGGKNV